MAGQGLEVAEAKQVPWEGPLKAVLAPLALGEGQQGKQRQTLRLWWRMTLRDKGRGRAHHRLLRNSPQDTSHLCSLIFRVKSLILSFKAPHNQATALGSSPTTLPSQSSAHHKPNDSFPSPPGCTAAHSLARTPRWSPQAHPPARPSQQTWEHGCDSPRAVNHL